MHKASLSVAFVAGSLSPAGGELDDTVKLMTRSNASAMQRAGSIASRMGRSVGSVRALSKVYRAKYLDGLRMHWQRGHLDLPPELSSLVEPQRDRWIRRLRKHLWVVYAKPWFAGPEKLLDYLSRYTHRVAISNHRIHSCDDGVIEFSYRDRQDGDRRKVETIPADEFISRFMRHVLPDRFTRIRHYGFLASRNKRRALVQIRQLLGTSPPPPTSEPSAVELWLLRIVGIDADRCPCCGSPLIEEQISPLRGVPTTALSSPSPTARPP